MDAGTFTPPLLPRYFGLCFFAFTPYFTCERITGIEPAFPAWEAGILAVVLYPHGDRFHLSREEESNPISRESNPALPVRTAAVLSIDCEVKTVPHADASRTNRRTVSLSALADARISLLL